MKENSCLNSRSLPPNRLIHFFPSLIKLSTFILQYYFFLEIPHFLEQARVNSMEVPQANLSAVFQFLQLENKAQRELTILPKITMRVKQKRKKKDCKPLGKMY